MEQASLRIDQLVNNMSSSAHIALVGGDQLPVTLTQKLDGLGNIISLETATEAQQLLEKDSVTTVIVVNSPTKVTLTYNSRKDQGVAYQFTEWTESYKEDQLATQLDSLGVIVDNSQTIRVEQNDLFNPMSAINDLISQVKNSLANILNLLVVLLVFWLVRNALLVSRHKPKDQLAIVGMTVFLVALSGMAVVGFGFYQGISIAQEGMIQNVIFTMKELLKWKNTGPSLLLWIPCWLFIIGIMGSLIFGTKSLLKSHLRSFWGVIVLSLIALVGLMPVGESPSLGQLLVPLYNVMNVGQLAMQGTLVDMDWWIAMGGTTVLALLALGLWWKVAKPVEED